MFLYGRPDYDNSKHTLELGKIIESGVNIWNFDSIHPIYGEGNGGELGYIQKKFEERFWFRQIGFETVGRWLRHFHARWNEIMPYYNDLWKTVQLYREMQDPLESYSLTETLERELNRQDKSNSTGSNTSSSETSGQVTRTSTNNATETVTAHEQLTIDGKEKFSDTPQGSIDNLDNHLTSATVKDSLEDRTNTDSKAVNEEVNSSDNSTGSATATSTDTGEVSSQGKDTEKYTLTRRGNIGVQPFGQEITILRQSLINIDKMFLDEFNDLFLMVY